MYKPAICHPKRIVYCKGLCKSCYNKQWTYYKPDKKRAYYERNREKQLAQGRKRYQENKEAKLQYCREYRKSHPEKEKNRRLIRLYGINLEDYNRILNEQNDQCKLCNQTPIKNPVIDHNHKTSKVRGIICQGCNILVGFIETRREAFNKVNKYLEEPE